MLKLDSEKQSLSELIPVSNVLIYLFFIKFFFSSEPELFIEILIMYIFFLLQFVMSRLQSTLENADVPDLLIAIVNVIFEISSGYPGIFSKHFRVSGIIKLCFMIQ